MGGGSVAKKGVDSRAKIVPLLGTSADDDGNVKSYFATKGVERNRRNTNWKL